MTAIDVLLPVRNARRTLPFALRDALGQRDVGVRVIAVVDVPAGGDDGSRALLADAARAERRLVVLDGPGRGAGAALDVGLAAVTSPLLAHMEADDRCAPDRLARQLAALRADAGLHAVVCRAGQFGARTPGMRRYLDWQNALLRHEQLAAERLVEIPALHQTGLYRSDSVRAAGGYAPRGPWPADIDFWLRWFDDPARRVLKLPRVLYRWRQHARQSTRAGGDHDQAALRAAKLHYLAAACRASRRDQARPQPLLLASIGETLETWRALLAADARFELRECLAWRPGKQAPPRQLLAAAPGVLRLAAYARPEVRDRVRAELSELIEPDDLLFTA